MNKLNCDYCGGTLSRDGGLYRCEHCGTAYENEDEVGEKKTLCTLAFEKLRRTEFDEADEAFSEILAAYGDCFEAYWGKLLAKYGVVFVDDIDGKKVPTCFDLIESVTNDALYKKVLALCPKSVLSSYVELAEKIENVRAEWAEKASKEPPYDIFICYKESDIEGGIERTADSVEASNLYTYLVQKGYRVFFSRETLRGKVAEKYEPYIFGAIQTAPVMIVYGQKREYFESIWVKNEWMRFIKRIEKGQKPSNGLIVAYEKMNAYDLPARLKSRQCMNAGAKTFYTDLVAHIERVIKSARVSVPRIETVEIKGKIARRKKRVNVNEVSLREPGNIKVEQITPNEAATLKTGYLFLEKGMWKNAAEAFNKALAENNFCGSAVWGGILSRAHAKNNDEFKAVCKNFTEFSEFARAVSCADASRANEYIKVFYDCATSLLDADANDKAAEFFSAVAPYKCKGRDEFIDGCLKIAINKSDENLLESVLAAVDPEKVDVHINAMTAFADRHLANGNFDVASAWYNKVLSADEGEVRALRGLVKCGIGCRNVDGYDGSVISLTDFQLFERLLSYCPSVSGEVEAAVNGLLAFGAGSDEEVKAACVSLNLKNVAAVFDRLVGYYPKADTRLFILSLYRIANIMLTAREFDEAERYFAMIVTESQNEYRAYWGLLKAKTKCATDKAVTRTSTDITEMGEFNSAVTAATMMGDEKFAETCIEISAKRVAESKERRKQEEVVREQKTVYKQRVIFNLCGLFVSVALSVAAIVMSAVMLVNGYEHGTVFMVISVLSACIVLCVGILFILKSMSVRNKTRGTVRRNEVVAAMKKMRIREVVAALVIVAMCFTVTTAFIGVAKEESSTFNQVTYESKEVEGGIALTNVTINSSSQEDVEIPSTIWGKKVVALGNGLFQNQSGIKRVTIPNGVESIGIEAFYGCAGLEKINIPDTVKTIGSRAFEGCKNLGSVVLPSELTSINERLFSGCVKLPNVTVPSGVKIIRASAFSGCTSLTGAVLPKGVKEINASAFKDCTALVSVNLPSSITTIAESAFSGCAKLRNITLPEGLKTVNSNTFENCTALNTVNLPRSLVTISNYAFKGCAALTIATLPSGLTSLGTSAFEGCSSLASLSIPSSLSEISNGAFRGCTALNGVTLPSGVTSIGESAFNGCVSLRTITIPSGVTSIGELAFNGCSSLLAVTLPNSMTTIGMSAFQGCNSLTGITLPFVGGYANNTVSLHFGYIFGANSYSSNSLFVPRSLKKVMINGGKVGAYAFYGCDSITSITIPSGVTSIGNYAFYNCSALASVTIPSGVTSIGENAFNGCDSLTSITIPESVTTIESGAFKDCSTLESISLPFIGERESGTTNTHFGYIFGASSHSYNSSYVPTSLKSVEIRGGAIADDAFYGCDSLTSVTIPSGVTSIGDYAFDGCSSLTSVTIGDGVASIGNYAFNGCSSLTSVTIPSGVMSIGNSAFYGCSSLASITIPRSVATIGDYAFEYCGSLTSITIPSDVTSIGERSFGYCSSLESISLPFVGESADGTTNSHFGYIFGATSYSSNSSHLPASLKSVEIRGGAIAGYAFNGCDSLTSVTIGDSVTSIAGFAFNGCSSLTSITIGDGVTSIGNYAFYNCSALASVTMPSDVTSIGNYAFYNCTSLTSIAIGDDVTSIGEGAFYNCTSLTSVTIPSGVTSIGNFAFYGCSALASVTIPSDVTSIGNYAFYHCSSLTLVTIPNSVTLIGVNAFYGCGELDEVYYAGTYADWVKITISSENTDLLNATRYYFSATQPEEEGDYWHYGEDGITPVKWESVQ